MSSGKTFKIFLLAAIIILSGINCYRISPNGSALNIVLSNNVDSKAIVPSIDMIVTSYRITGTGPNDALLPTIADVPASQDTVEISDLSSGSWTITVTGLNSGGIAIGRGHGTVAVSQSDDSTLAIAVSPLTGSGTLHLTASWDTSSVGTNPVLNATLTPVGSTTSVIPFTMNVASSAAVYSNTAIEAGYYILSLVLLDGTSNCGGAVDIIRIAAGQTSSGIVSLVLSNHGVIGVTITQQMNEPVTVALSGILSSITAASSMTVAASASNASGVTYYWYIDGVSVANGSSYTVNGSTLASGQHRLDVLAITSDNLRAGSASFTFTVTN